MLKILIVDDSLVFRRFLGDIFDDYDDILIVGEASNGIEALELLLDKKPDVILLDLEMPLMDGMTALQHFMIHRPTPTIMFSSLSEEGTARCFDTLKNGAVDFLSKDFIFRRRSLANQKRLLIDKVRKAGRMKRLARDPFVTQKKKKKGSLKAPPLVQWALFCEDCGNREIVTIDPAAPRQHFICSACGDTIDYSLTSQEQYRRNIYVTVLVGGSGSYSNYLEIIPFLGGSIGGAILALVEVENSGDLKNLAEYMDAISQIRVVRAEAGMSIEPGNCYLFAYSDNFNIKHSSAQPFFIKIEEDSSRSPVDTLLGSSHRAFASHSSVVFLSGNEVDGGKGLKAYGAAVKLLNKKECFFYELTDSIAAQLKGIKLPRMSVVQIAADIMNNHREVKEE